MNSYYLDLHVHTVLSPCAHLLMTPGNILKKAAEKNIRILAITDHNSAENVEVTMKMASKYSIKIIPGMELETAEEVHLLCLFPELDPLIQLQQLVYENLPQIKNREDFFGYQLITDLDDQYTGKCDRFLAGSVNLSIDRVVEEVRKLGGFIIPAHINRAKGILTNLGFIPEYLNFSLVEINKKSSNKLKKQTNFPIVINSDSHFLDDIKPYIEILPENLQFTEIIKTLSEEKGQKNLLTNKDG